ncbi:hypothetical protein AVEN_214549-1, partial [Araneus ventricosus]
MSTPVVARSIVNKERNYIFPNKINPGVRTFCGTGGLRRNRDHRVKT